MTTRAEPQWASIFRSELLMRLLGLLLLDPSRRWTSAELREHLEATGASTHRELQRALASGVVTRQPIGRTYLYRALVESPLYEPLRALLERTVGVEVELRQALEGLAGVEAAFIHGSFASGSTLRPARDIDVLVLGDVDYRALRKRLREVEQRVGHEIDVLSYTSNEFATLVADGNSFARAVANGPVLTLVGANDVIRGAAEQR